LSLIEKAQETIDQRDAKALEKKLRTASFDLEDFLKQMQQIKKMGPLSQILEMIPGLSGMVRKLPAEAMDEKQMRRVEAIIYSMTPEERRRPDILDGSRRRRVARGSGVSPQEVNQLLNQFKQMQKMMRAVATQQGKGRGAPKFPMQF
ncbi:MAG: signal recognition particle protein, partial [Chloroflexota bacterium]